MQNGFEMCRHFRVKKAKRKGAKRYAQLYSYFEYRFHREGEAELRDPTVLALTFLGDFERFFGEKDSMMELGQ